MRKIVWFSCGAASAIASKLAVEKYKDCEVLYCDTLASEHPDNKRFLEDVSRWIGKEIKIIKSEKFKDVDDVIAKTRYMSGISGARCTIELKKKPREMYQRIDDIHIFGFTADEQKRADRFDDNNNLNTEWILIDNKIYKDDCYRILKEANIELPMMYKLGFEHNNCIGCVKSTSTGYWNKIRKLFPEVFETRCKQSRLLNVKLTRQDGKRIFLDELRNDENEPDDDIECGVVCQMPLDLR